MKKALSVGTIFALGLVIGLASSHADQVVNVDFNVTDGAAGTYTGTAVAPDTGATWNGLAIGLQLTTVASYTSPTLVHSFGGSTSVQVSLTNFRPFDSGGVSSSFAPALLNDIAAGVSADTPSTPSPMGFTISGLTSGGLYDLYLYSQNGGFNNAGTAFTINSVTKTVANPAPASFSENLNYVKYLNLVATGGTISGTLQTTIDGNASAFNGFQIVEVPEPTVGLLVVAGCALLWRRIRRK